MPPYTTYTSENVCEDSSEMPEPVKEYKLVVLGSGGVGKSALTIRLITENFLEDYDPTIEDSYRKQLLIDKEPALLDILDTAGQEEYTSMQDQWMREGKGFLLVYNITSRSSFDDAIAFKQKILRAKDAKDAAEVPIVLVGNKVDLAQYRQVSEAEAQFLAKDWKCRVVETSAKEKINNVECFYEAVRAIRAMEKPDTVPKSAPPSVERKGKKKKKRSRCIIL